MTAAARPRSESPWDPEGQGSAGGDQESLRLFNAAVAKKKVEQDAMLLANRIRLLKAEESKTRKKIRETENRTAEIVNLQRRNEERRQQREAEFIRKEAEEQAIRERQQQEREARQRQKNTRSSSLLIRNQEARNEVLQARLDGQEEIQRRKEEVLAIAGAKRDKIRSASAASAARRERSEDERRVVSMLNFEKKVGKQEQERLAKERVVKQMEAEEQALIERLQRSQEQQRRAFERLEDVLAIGSEAPGGSMNHSAMASSISADSRISVPRPPRPRAPPSIPGTAVSTPARGTRPRSDNIMVDPSASVPPSPAASGPAPGSSLTYTTVDGQQLDIPAEDDLDLAELLAV